MKHKNTKENKMKNIGQIIKSLDFTKYSEYFTKEKFEEFIRSFGPKLKFIRPLLQLYFCFIDPKTPFWYKALAAGVIGYVILPFDLVPDLLPVAGFADDALAVAFMIGQGGALITEEHSRKADEVLRRLSGGTYHLDL
ncbi:MAG: DUF1232 domain-containing protein [Chlorobiota bacterium]|nr:MAG: DUF1232 domain-containing protein [Chlorobiota bacterium]